MRTEITGLTRKSPNSPTTKHRADLHSGHRQQEGRERPQHAVLQRRCARGEARKSPPDQQAATGVAPKLEALFMTLNNAAFTGTHVLSVVTLDGQIACVTASQP